MPEVPAHATIERPILVVEDDEDTVAALQILLADEGYPSIAASDAQNAIQQLARHDPGLVLLDWSLHGGSGEDVLAAAHGSNVSHTPVVLMTGNSNLTQRTSIWAEAILRKPFDLKELLGMVARYYRP